ncbi:chemotaxis protein CheW [Pseudobutyrivibrio ruminis]|uniref:chemotaxis protein CheW n=1 Tax=Pseudobutyrivibrio ruminis TaxID=46206 RepID=UPI0003F912C1|nr:chemotaxis protein CheW [Pseudobutyrivibrio ruminis]
MANFINNSNSSDEKQYIIFTLNNEFYGIDIIHINTIIMMPEITDVPLSADYIKGMISLRGHIIPVINLHKRMNYGEEVITKDTRIIVFNINENEQVGIVVDTVKEVMVISNEEIEFPSPFMKSEDSFISGVGKKPDMLVSILDINSIVDDNTLAECIA